MEAKRVPYGAGNYFVTNAGDIINAATGRVLVKKTAKTGYQEVSLYDHGTAKTFLVHRLVAEAFLSGPGDEVNHINGNKADNRVENLERCNRAENLKHAFLTGLREDDVSPKAVLARNERTGEVQEFPSIYRAARFLGVSQGNICMCCNGLRPMASGYTFSYKDRR